MEYLPPVPMPGWMLYEAYLELIEALQATYDDEEGADRIVRELVL